MKGLCNYEQSCFLCYTKKTWKKNYIHDELRKYIHDFILIKINRCNFMLIRIYMKFKFT